MLFVDLWFSDLFVGLTGAVQDRLNSWLSKTQNFFNEALVKTGHSGKPEPGNEFDIEAMEDIFMTEQTIDSNTPSGILSLAAIVSIEQFSRWEMCIILIKFAFKLLLLNVLC